MVWSVTVTKFGTTRTGVVGGAWERPVDPRAHSRTVITRNFCIGHLIALPLGFQYGFPFWPSWPPSIIPLTASVVAVSANLSIPSDDTAGVAGIAISNSSQLLI